MKKNHRKHKESREKEQLYNSAGKLGVCLTALILDSHQMTGTKVISSELQTQM